MKLWTPPQQKRRVRDWLREPAAPAAYAEPVPQEHPKYCCSVWPHAGKSSKQVWSIPQHTAQLVQRKDHAATVADSQGCAQGAGVLRHVHERLMLTVPRISA